MDEKGVLFNTVVDENKAALFGIVDNFDQDETTKMPIETKSLIYIDLTDPYGVKEKRARYVAVAADKTLCRFWFNFNFNWMV